MHEPGDAIAFVALVSELPPSPDGLVIVPYLNGSLWGAPTPVDSLGSASLLIPCAFFVTLWGGGRSSVSAL